MNFARDRAETTRNFSLPTWSASTREPRERGVFSCGILYQSDSLVVLEVTGKGAFSRFAPEAGVHRWQRVPPTEKRGRRQSSTITVAVLPVESGGRFAVDPKEVEETTTKGSGPGGQHKNKVETCVVLRHTSTGLTVRIQNERSQSANREAAWAILAAKLRERAELMAMRERNGERKRQVGDSDRAEKIRTVQEQNGKVVGHLSGKRCSLKEYLKGRVDLVQ